MEGTARVREAQVVCGFSSSCDSYEGSEDWRLRLIVAEWGFIVGWVAKWGYIVGCRAKWGYIVGLLAEWGYIVSLCAEWGYIVIGLLAEWGYIASLREEWGYIVSLLAEWGYIACLLAECDTDKEQDEAGRARQAHAGAGDADTHQAHAAWRAPGPEHQEDVSLQLQASLGHDGAVSHRWQDQEAGRQLLPFKVWWHLGGQAQARLEEGSELEGCLGARSAQPAELQILAEAQPTPSVSAGDEEAAVREH
jgi:hypothetical protein